MSILLFNCVKEKTFFVKKAQNYYKKPYPPCELGARIDEQKWTKLQPKYEPIGFSSLIRIIPAKHPNSESPGIIFGSFALAILNARN